jgi:hypothetical protein
MKEKKIFISYRRSDSAGHTGRLYDYLVNYFGEDRIFMDVVAIKPGVDFAQDIENTLHEADMVIVIIGNSWLDIRAENDERRLDDPNDLVRLEVETGLKLEIPIVPVLIQSSQMPGEKDLPPSINELAKRNALRLSDDHWTSDVNYLTDVLELSFNVTGSLAQQSATRLKKWVIAGFVILIFGTLVQNQLELFDLRLAVRVADLDFDFLYYLILVASVVTLVILSSLLFRFVEESNKLLSYMILGLGVITNFLAAIGFELWTVATGAMVLGLLNLVEYKHR